MALCNLPAIYCQRNLPRTPLGSCDFLAQKHSWIPTAHEIKSSLLNHPFKVLLCGAFFPHFSSRDAVPFFSLSAQSLSIPKNQSKSFFLQEVFLNLSRPYNVSFFSVLNIFDLASNCVFLHDITFIVILNS